MVTSWEEGHSSNVYIGLMKVLIKKLILWPFISIHEVVAMNKIL